MAERLAKKLLLIGWDAADWKLINPLVDQAKMPALEYMINHGVIGNLATLRPILSPMLWNSIATGKRPDKHGILGFIEPDPDSGKLRPVTSTSRKVKALWNICTQSGLRSHVLGWFAGHPRSLSTAFRFRRSMPSRSRLWTKTGRSRPNSIYPPALAETLAAFRVHPGQLTEAEILPFVPRAGEVDQEKDQHLSSLAKILAENCSLHNAATWILENESWDFLAVYYNGIDHFCHAFMNFHPPRQATFPKRNLRFTKTW